MLVQDLHVISELSVACQHFYMSQFFIMLHGLLEISSLKRISKHRYYNSAFTAAFAEILHKTFVLRDAHRKKYKRGLSLLNPIVTSTVST